MYSEYLNSNRYKITKFAFSVFVILGILNLNFGSGVKTYADEEVAPAPTEVVEAPRVEETVVAEPVVEEATAGEAVVQTGDAVSATNVENEQNTNNITTEDTSNLEDTNTSTTTTNLTITGENSATTTNTVLGDSNTGENLATSSATTTVSTGDAIATADVVNEVNTTVADSEGSIAALSGSLGGGSLDLRNGLENQGTSTCSSCVASTTITNQNTATVTNAIYLNANTGSNTASSSATTTVITGDAIAAANVVNVVNTNIVDSNYFLFVFNDLGDWSGDLILPNGDFFANLFASFNVGICNTCMGSTNITNSNGASILNSVNSDANTGDNIIMGQEAASLITGNAVSSTNVVNEVNTNVYNDSSFYLLIKVLGDWSGDIFNLPSNIGWQNTPEGIVLYDKSHNPFDQNGSQGSGQTYVENNNTASVLNDVNLNASTGNNEVEGGSSLLKTGNAYTGANVINVVNTNIISSNWVRALVNVFGNWTGNISFGQPNLWVGTVLNSNGSIGPGSLVNFKTTIKNNGDALASNIILKVFSNSEDLKFSGEMYKYIDAGNLLPGESKEINYDGYVNPLLGFGSHHIDNHIVATLHETDANFTDNNDDVKVLAVNDNGPTVMLGYNSRESSFPDLVVSKSHTLLNSVVIDGKETVPIDSGVDYKVVVKNNGGVAFEGVLIDQLKNEAGEIISEQVWNLDKILAGEQIEVTYTTNFSASTTPGVYTNYAWVEALGGDYSFDRALATDATSNLASDSVTVSSLPVVPEPEAPEPVVGEVLGVLSDNALGVIDSIDYTSNYDYLNGLCVDKNDTGRKISIKETLLYSLSFVLIVRRKKDIPMNLFML